MTEEKSKADFYLQMADMYARKEDEMRTLAKMCEPNFGGCRPPHLKKSQEDLELSDFAKVIRPQCQGKTTYARIPIRRKDPLRILTYAPIKDDEDLEKRIKAIAQWFKDMMSEYNIVIEFDFQALTVKEMDSIIESGEEGVLMEVERKE